MKPASGFWLLVSLLAFLTVSRAIFWAAHPPNFDFVNFALGVERFAPADHQPHPPGYPLVILLARLFATAGVSTVTALHLTALAGSAAAVLGAWRLGGPLAAVLLAIEPTFWFSGVTSPTRPYLAAGVCWLLCACRRVSERRAAWLWITAALAALFGGFRPELLLLFAAPAAIAARQGGFGWCKIALAAAFCGIAASPWMLWTAASFHSPHGLFHNYYYYYLHHTSTTSAALGAPAGAWQGMLLNALLWNAIPAAVAAAGFLLARAAPDRRFLVVAGTYFVPAMLVQMFVHQGADSPDHSLGTIALLLVIGASLLRSRWPAAAAAAAMLCVSFATPGVASLPAFRAAQRTQAAALEELRAALRPADVIVVAGNSPLSGRLLEWEFPAHVVLALDSGWRFSERRQSPLPAEGIALPAVQRLQILGGPKKAILERACAALACRDYGWRIEAAAGDWKGTIELPPYLLRLSRD